MEHYAQQQRKATYLYRKEYQEATGRVNVPVAERKDGSLIVEDLAEIPHILICGKKQRGKTALIKSMLVYALGRYSDNELQVNVYDSSGEEAYRAFRDRSNCMILEHNYQLLNMLRDMQEEISSRFAIMAEYHARSHKAYQQKATPGAPNLPSILLIIDDVTLSEVKTQLSLSLGAILTNGRVAGVHCLIVTSDLPEKEESLDVLTLVPYRIVFQTNKAGTSSILMLSKGAETLDGQGKLFIKWFAEFECGTSVHVDDQNIKDTMEEIAHNSFRN